MYSRGSSGRPTRDPSDTIVSAAKHEDTRGAKSACLYLWCSESTDGPRSTLKIPSSNTRIFTIREDTRGATLPPDTIVYYILEEVRRTDGLTLPVLLFFCFCFLFLFFVLSPPPPPPPSAAAAAAAVRRPPPPPPSPCAAAAAAAVRRRRRPPPPPPSAVRRRRRRRRRRQPPPPPPPPPPAARRRRRRRRAEPFYI